MQDRYIGDVGDFAKYSLLRLFQSNCSGTPLRVGVIWYLIDDETHNLDGRHIAYLHDLDIAACDSFLHSVLAKIVNRAARSVLDLERASLFSSEHTTFFSERIQPGNVPARDAWFNRALAATADADFVFVDPDNGLEVPSVPPGSRKANKYARLSEVQAFVERGQSVLLYQHHDRSAPVTAQIQRTFGRLAALAARNSDLAAITFRRGSTRSFFLIAAPAHSGIARSILESLAQSPWNIYFHATRRN